MRGFCGAEIGERGCQKWPNRYRRNSRTETCRGGASRGDLPPFARGVARRIRLSRTIGWVNQVYRYPRDRSRQGRHRANSPGSATIPDRVPRPVNLVTSVAAQHTFCESFADLPSLQLGDGVEYALDKLCRHAGGSESAQVGGESRRCIGNARFYNCTHIRRELRAVLYDPPLTASGACTSGVGNGTSETRRVAHGAVPVGIRFAPRFWSRVDVGTAREWRRVGELVRRSVGVAGLDSERGSRRIPITLGLCGVPWTTAEHCRAPVARAR